MKILVTRTAPFRIFEKSLKKIRAHYPDCVIHVLIQHSSVKSLDTFGAGLIPLVINDGPFRLAAYGTSLVRRVRRERFDIVVLLYGNEKGTGYLNLNLLALLAGTEREMIFDLAENFYENRLPLLGVIKKSLLNGAGQALYISILIVLKYWKTFRGGDRQKPRESYEPEIAPGRRLKGRGKSKKRIVMVDLMFTWPPHGGACVDFRELATRLVRRGYDVKVVVPAYDSFFPRGKVDSRLFPVETHKVYFSPAGFNRFTLQKKIAGVVERLLPDHVYLGDSYFLKPFLYSALKKHRIISRFYTYELLCPNYYLMYRNGAKCTLDYLKNPLECMKCGVEGMKKRISSLDLEVWSHEFLTSLAFLPSYHESVKEGLLCCETLITYNSLASGRLQPFHPDVKTFPGGVDTGCFFPGYRRPGKVKRILVTGRLMDPRKGLLFFIENIRRLRRERDDFEVLITHDNNFGEEYITALGWVEHASIRDIYNKVDICVVPSLWEEPFGMVAVEAMASAKPVIASSVSGLCMSVADGVTGLLFPPGNGEKMLNALNRLLDSPDLIHRMGAAGRKRAEEFFDWERIVDRYCDEIFER